MAAPKMTRHDMKQDELVTAIDKVSGYVTKNTETVRNWGLALAGVVAIGVLIWWMTSSRSAAADAMLLEAQTRFAAPVVPSGAVPDGPSPTYATEADRDRAALEVFDRLVAKYGGSTGRMGRYYQGILLAKLGRTDEAQTVLQKFVDSPSSPTLGALANAQLANVKEKKGDLDGAAKIFTDLVDAKDGAYPKDWALYYLAGIQERQGKATEAAASYQRIVTEVPTSPFAQEAGLKVKRKGAAPAVGTIPTPAPAPAAPPPS